MSAAVPRPIRASAAQVLWNTLIGVIPLGGKNSQQIQGAVQKQIKTYQKLMEAFTSTSRAEQALINHVQACLRARLLGPCSSLWFRCCWLVHHMKCNRTFLVVTACSNLGQRCRL